jgi:hypothetical protein
MVSGSFDSPKGVLFIFQSPYLFTIGHREYLALEGGPPGFTQSSTSSTLLWDSSQRRAHVFEYRAVTVYGRPFQIVLLTLTPRGPATPVRRPVWADPLSLAATHGVSVDFLSSSYLDVSVRWVDFDGLCIHPPMTPSGCPVTPGFPIRTSPDQCAFDHSPGLFAAYHVLHRLSMPRHPPCTLNSLTTLMRS